MEHAASRVFTSQPVTVIAFQWDPKELGSLETSPQYYPRWAVDLRLEGKLREVLNSKEESMCLGNKRGDYRALPGDWIVKDQFGHVFVVSSKTFNQRFQEITK